VTGPLSCEAAGLTLGARPLHIRWLGRVPYREAHALQRGLFLHSDHDHLLLLEHPAVYTLGVRGDLGHILRDPVDIDPAFRGNIETQSGFHRLQLRHDRTLPDDVQLHASVTPSFSRAIPRPSPDGNIASERSSCSG